MADRYLYEIAADVRRNWSNVNFAAVPYLEAMQSLATLADSYFYDSAESIVRYFLANANAWRGDHARRVKAELRGMLAGVAR